MSARSARARGSVLAVVVLLLVALGLVAHGALVMAGLERAASRAGARVLQARAAAEAALAEQTVAPLPDSLGSAPLGAVVERGGGAVGGHPFRASLTRLSREFWLARGEGSAAGEAWTLRSGRVLWVLDPVARLEAAGAVVEVGEGASAVTAGVVEGDTRGRDPEEPTGSACARWAPSLDTLARMGRWPPLTRVPPATGGEPALGRVGPAALAHALPPAAEPSGTPRPSVVAGRCDEADPWNLGDPDPQGPCAGYLPGRWFPGDALLVGGVGQGLLVVAGDLELAGTRYDGVALVGGVLRVTGGAWLRGRARAARGLEVDAASRVSGSGCRVLRATDAVRRALGVPVPVAGTSLPDPG